MEGSIFFLGDECAFLPARSRYISSAYDTVNKKVVIAYQDYTGGINNQDGMVVVGTISDLGITFGTPVVIRDLATTTIDIAFDETSGKFIFIHWSSTAVVGTVVGNTITFGSPVTIAPWTTMYPKVCAAAGVVMIACIKDELIDKGYVIAGIVSGDTITFGTPVQFEELRPETLSITYDQGNGKFVIAYSLYTSPYGGSAVVCSVAGTVVSVSTAYSFAAERIFSPAICYDASASKLTIAYFTNTSKGVVISGEVSGTSLSFSATPIQFSSSSFSNDTDIIFNPEDSAAYLVYTDYDIGNAALMVKIFWSAGVLLVSDVIVLSADSSGYTSIVYDSYNNRMVVSYYNIDTGKSVSRVFWYGPGIFWTNFSGQSELTE